MGRPCVCCGCRCHFKELDADKMNTPEPYETVPTIRSMSYETESRDDTGSPWKPNCKDELAPAPLSPYRWSKLAVEVMATYDPPDPDASLFPDSFDRYPGSLLEDPQVPELSYPELLPWSPPSPYVLSPSLTLEGNQLISRFFFDTYDLQSTFIGNLAYIGWMFDAPHQPNGNRLLTIRWDQKSAPVSDATTATSARIIYDATYNYDMGTGKYHRSGVSVFSDTPQVMPSTIDIHATIRFFARQGDNVGWISAATTTLATSGDWVRRRMVATLATQFNRLADPPVAGETWFLDLSPGAPPIYFGLGTFIFATPAVRCIGQKLPVATYSTTFTLRQQYDHMPQMIPFSTEAAWDNVCVQLD